MKRRAAHGHLPAFCLRHVEQLCANMRSLSLAELELCPPPRLTQHLAVNTVAPLTILRQPYSACLLSECPNHLYGGKQPRPHGWCGLCDIFDAPSVDVWNL